MRRIMKFGVSIAAASLVLTACGGSGSSDDNDNAADGSTDNTSSAEDICASADGDGPKIGVAYDVGGRGDQSFNDSAYAGVVRAVEELDATCQEAEAGANEDDVVRAERLRTLAEAGFNPVIGVGFLYSPAAAEVAAEFPDTEFAVIDGYSEFVAPADNLVDLTFAANEGSFLVGVAAALKSESDTIGFIGGTPGDLIKEFEAGFVAGVKAAKPEAELLVQYLTQDPDDSDAFEDPPGARTAAEGMIDRGADVIYHAAGKSGLGLFQAVVEAGEGVWAIGVDSDQYLTASADQQPQILTSMLKRIDTAIYDFTAAMMEGEEPSGGRKYDLSDEGVGYSTSGGFIDDITGELDDYAQQIIDGEIEVPTAP